MNRIRRRQFLITAGTLFCPTFAPAQNAPRSYRIGVLTTEPPEIFQQSLRELGYVEGRNTVFEVRNSRGRIERLDDDALDLVGLKVDVIVASNPASVLSAKRATPTIPIVMVNSPDPVQLGLVSSLSSPGGNITGVTTLSVDLSIKQLSLLKAAIPHASRVALLWNPNNPWHPIAVKGLQAGSGSLGIHLQVLEIRGTDAFDSAFHAMTTEGAQAVLVLADPMTFTNRRRLADLAIRYRLPMMGSLREYADAGGLMTYWADRTDLNRRVASYVDRILKGAKPGDLPIEQPTKFELVINLKTAKALGLTIPQSLILRADEVIQ